LIANARFLSFFQKTIYKVKIIGLKKNQIIQNELKSRNLRVKNFLSENYKVAKSFPSRQKKLKKSKSVKMHRPPKFRQ
jgi:hypothetical protein